MANNEYAITGLVDPKSQKDIEALITELQKASNIAKEISLNAGNAKTIKDSAIAQEKLNKAQDATALNAKKIEAIQNKINLDNQRAIDKRVADEAKQSNARLAQLAKEAKAEEVKTAKIQKQAEAQNKLLNAFKSAPVGSINQLSSANAILNKRLREVNQTTDAGRVKANNLRSAIDKNTEKIRQASPAWKQQQMNIGNYGSAMGNIGGVVSKVTGFLGGLGIAMGIGTLAVGAFNRALTLSDALGDKWAMTQEGMKEATDAFFRSIMDGDWSNLIDNMKEAYEDGKRYADMLDLLEDRSRAVSLRTNAIDTEIIKFKNMARDRSIDLTIRRNAINEIVKLEEEKLKVTKKLADDELDNKAQNISKYSGLSKQAIKVIIADESKIVELNDAWALHEAIKNKAMATTYDREGSAFTHFDMVKYNKEMSLLTAAERARIGFAKEWNRVTEKDRKELTNLMINKEKTDQGYLEGMGSIVKLKNKLETEFITTEKKNNKAKKAWTLSDDASFIEEKKALELERINGEIKTNEELNKQILELEIFYLQKRVATRKDSGQELIDLEQQVRDKMIQKIDGSPIEEKKEEKKEETKDSVDEELLKLEILKQKDLQINALLYKKKAITKEQYEEENERIEIEYSKRSLDLAIATAEKQLKILEAIKGKKKPEQVQQIIDLEKQIAEYKTTLVVRENEEDDKQHQKKMERLKEYAETTKTILGSISELYSAISAQQIANIDNESAVNETARKKELDALENRGRVRTALEKKQDSINDKYNKKQLDLQRKKDQIEYNQAVWKKAQAISELAIQTALAIVEAKGNVLKIALVSSLGAISLATILAQKIPPVPKYATGTNFHGGGLAEFGEAGREIVQLPNDELFLSHDKSTIMDLPRGAKVFNNFQTEKILASNNYVLDLKSLEAKQDKTNKYLSKIAEKDNNIRIFVNQSDMRNKYKYN